MNSMKPQKKSRFGKSFKMNSHIVTNKSTRTRIGVNNRRKNRSNFQYTPQNKAISNSTNGNAVEDLL